MSVWGTNTSVLAKSAALTPSSLERALEDFKNFRDGGPPLPLSDGTKLRIAIERARECPSTS
jgi:hypothetical protein